MDNKSKFNKIFGWIILIAALASAFLIKYYKEYSTFFLVLLLVEFFVALIFSKKIFDKNVIRISRILLGLLFIYSGFVKAVDPMGTNYKIIDYFIAYGTEWASPVALYLSIFLNAFEFVVGGFLLLLNIKIRTVSWLVVLMMVFFTLTTAFDAIYNPVPDCGCFGEAIILTNWQTFYKNIVIDTLVVILFFNRGVLKKYFTSRGEWAIIGVAVVMVVYFQVYNYNHLPLVDFRAWKVGNKMITENPEPMKYYLTYMNKETGEKKEFLSPNYPFNDSVWLSKWIFVNQRIEDPNPKKHDLVILDKYGSDVTEQFVENEDFQFFLIAYDLLKVKKKVIPRINEFYKQCDNIGISFIVLTSSTPEEIEEFKKEYDPANFEYYFADDTSLEAIIRANPGLVLLKNGVVKGKWHYNDFPDFQEFIDRFYNTCSLPK